MCYSSYVFIIRKLNEPFPTHKVTRCHISPNHNLDTNVRTSYVTRNIFPLNIYLLDVISGFRRDVDEICDLLGLLYSVNSVTTFRDDLSVPYSRAQKTSWPLKIWPRICPETSIRNYHSRLRNVVEERRCHLPSILHLY